MAENNKLFNDVRFSIGICKRVRSESLDFFCTEAQQTHQSHLERHGDGEELSITCDHDHERSFLWF